jgi:hypothetical protein
MYISKKLNHGKNEKYHNFVAEACVALTAVEAALEIFLLATQSFSAP